MLPPLILLAAGKSSRMGTPKGLLTIHNTKWINYQILQLESIGINRVIVVLGAFFEDYMKTLDLLPNTISLTIVKNHQFELGQFSSIHLGFKTFQEKYSQELSCFLLPIDTPCPQIQVWKKLLHFMNEQPTKSRGVVIPAYKEKKGHPILIHHSCINNITQLAFEENSRLDHIIDTLESHQRPIINVDDDFVCCNINTLSDWTAFQTRLS